MPAGYVIAILLCLGDNCDLVRPEPATSYPNYETCSDAVAKNAAKLGDIAARSREAGREGEIICLREQPIPSTSGKTVSRPAAAADRAPAPQPPPSAPQGQAAVVTPPPAATTSAPAEKEFRDCEQCPAMVKLPGGQFEMGSLADASERPPHRVQLARFALGKYELTQREWKACVAAGACSDKPRVAAGDDRFPMMDLSWDDAALYVQWLRGLTGKPYRLPSEAEWEYAARAGATTPYPWGKEIGVARANCRGCGGNYDPRVPAAVGSFPPNPWGLHDMLGGVAEWTEDCWHKNYESAPADGSAWQSRRCPEHVLRGGSWKNPPADITASSRNFYDGSVRYVANGLRVAVTLP
jgi:formylglycine-generating enzyme required for sulfatase activity